MEKSDDKMANKARKWIARVKKNATQTKTELSEWEDEFLLSLDERLEKYGRAFCDPDKGAMNAPLSLLQGLKVKEIGKKAKPKEENSIKPKLKARKELKTKKSFVTKSGFKRISTKSNSKTLNDPNKV